MTSILAKLGIAAMVIAGAASAGAPAAFASGLTGNVEQVRWDSGHRSCSSSLAVRRARDMGLRNAHVTRMDSRRVTVEGRDSRGRWQRIFFANTSGCPLVRR